MDNFVELAGCAVALFAACGVFVGSNSWEDVGSAFTEPILQIIFWLLHLMGLFTSAGAAITAIGSGDMRENWQNCGYFNRVSSRAAADFHHALLRAAGVTEEEARVN